MKTISVYLAISVSIVMFIFGVAFGYAFTPEYTTSMYDKNAMNLGPADRTFDLRYINAMIGHHRGAMLLATQLGAHTKRPEMKALSEAILKDEPAAIAELYAWKKAWYGDVRPVRDPVVANLGTYDEKFDLRFLNAIIAHHEAGVTMTRETRTKSSRTEILNNVDAVEAFLSGGIIKLKGLRTSWYKI